MVGCTTPIYDAPVDAGQEPAREAAPAEDEGAHGDENLLPDAEPARAAIDAGEDGAAGDEATTVRALDDWQRLLLGTYAVKTVAFSVDADRTISRDVTVALAHIAQLADGTVEVSSQMCHWLAENRLTRLTLDFPERLPTSRQKVRFEDIGGERRWSTEPQVVTAGYDEQVPARCSGRIGGEYVMRGEEQTWISGDSCRCPESADSPPMLVTDCRITDADRDTKPGLTFTITPLFGSPSKVFAATYDRSYLVFGNIASDGAHNARLAMEFRGYQLGCTGLGCDDLSTANTLAVPCPSDLSRVQFAPLDPQTAPADGWSCSALLAQLGALFPLSDPEIPDRCM